MVVLVPVCKSAVLSNVNVGAVRYVFIVGILTDVSTLIVLTKLVSLLAIWLSVYSLNRIVPDGCKWSRTWVAHVSLSSLVLTT